MPKRIIKKGKRGTPDGVHLIVAPRHLDVLCRSKNAACAFLKFVDGKPYCYGELPLKRTNNGRIMRPVPCVENPPKWEHDHPEQAKELRSRRCKQPFCPDCIADGKTILKHGKRGYCLEHWSIRKKGYRATQKRKERDKRRRNAARIRRYRQACKARNEAILSVLPGAECTAGTLVLPGMRACQAGSPVPEGQGGHGEVSGTGRPEEPAMPSMPKVGDYDE